MELAHTRAIFQQGDHGAALERMEQFLANDGHSARERAAARRIYEWWLENVPADSKARLTELLSCLEEPEKSPAVKRP